MVTGFSLGRALLRFKPEEANPNAGMNPNMSVDMNDQPMQAGPQMSMEPPQGPSPQMMRLLQPTQEEQAYQDLSRRGPSEHHGGIWDRIKDALMAGGLAARSAPPEDRGLAMLGGLGGGLVNPNVAHNLKYRTWEMPEAQRRAGISREMADSELGRKEGYAKLYGRDPDTNQPTMGMQTAEDRQQMGLMRNDIALLRAQQTGQNLTDLARHRGVTEKQGADKVSISQMRSKVAAFNALMRARQMTPEQLQESADTLGIDIPEGTDPQIHDLKVDAGGNIVRVGRVSGPLPKSFETTKEQGRNTRQQIGLRSRVNKPSLASVKAAITDEWIKSGKTPSGMVIQDGRVIDPHAKLTPAEENQALQSVIFGTKVKPGTPEYQQALEEERNKIRATKGQPLERHPEYQREVNKRLAGTSQQQTAYPQLTKNNIKAGGTYTHQGKQIKINQVNPDGTFTADILP